MIVLQFVLHTAMETCVLDCHSPHLVAKAPTVVFIYSIKKSLLTKVWCAIVVSPFVLSTARHELMS